MSKVMKFVIGLLIVVFAIFIAKQTFSSIPLEKTFLVLSLIFVFLSW